jgi:hypothetical protein
MVTIPATLLVAGTGTLSWPGVAEILRKRLSEARLLYPTSSPV